MLPKKDLFPHAPVFIFFASYFFPMLAKYVSQLFSQNCLLKNKFSQTPVAQLSGVCQLRTGTMVDHG